MSRVPSWERFDSSDPDDPLAQLLRFLGSSPDNLLQMTLELAQEGQLTRAQVQNLISYQYGGLQKQPCDDTHSLAFAFDLWMDAIEFDPQTLEIRKPPSPEAQKAIDDAKALRLRILEAKRQLESSYWDEHYETVVAVRRKAGTLLMDRRLREARPSNIVSFPGDPEESS